MEYRAMMQADVPAVAAIEANVYDGWSEGGIRAALDADACRCFVAVDAGDFKRGEICAFCAWTFVDGTASLDALSVAPHRRRAGVAHGLLCFAEAQLQRAGARQLWLEVRRENAPARALYTKLCFVQNGLRRGFYQNPPDDAMLMEKALACTQDNKTTISRKEEPT